MFGNNPIRSKTTDPDNLSVEEMFYTIQGEGPLSGRAALFIRMAGCNLACHFCDTQFETKADQTEPVDLILQKIRAMPLAERKLVVITGGEPLRQNISKLVEGLFVSGTQLVQIETAGTLWQEDLRPWVEEGRVILVCSPKTPKVHPAITELCRHWKYIIIDDGGYGWDGLPGVGTQPSTRIMFQPLYRCPGRHDDAVWVSPCDQQDPHKNKKNMDLATLLVLRFGYRLSLQVHKIINLP